MIYDVIDHGNIKGVVTQILPISDVRFESYILKTLYHPFHRIFQIHIRLLRIFILFSLYFYGSIDLLKISYLADSFLLNVLMVSVVFTSVLENWGLA